MSIIYPDQRNGELGTLFIPNTVAIIKGCPHPPAARMLVDYALSPDVEERLAAGLQRADSTRLEGRVTSRLDIPAGIRQMQVDFDMAADAWETASKFLAENSRGIEASPGVGTSLRTAQSAALPSRVLAVLKLTRLAPAGCSNLASWKESGLEVAERSVRLCKLYKVARRARRKIPARFPPIVDSNAVRVFEAIDCLTSNRGMKSSA